MAYRGAAPLTAGQPGRIRLPGSPVQQVSAQTVDYGDIESCPLDPRRPALVCEPGCDPYAAGYVVECEGESPLTYPDEYLFDGGDGGLPVHYGSYGLGGLESEDTVIEYTDETGKQRIKHTNRVAVYAPRFGAVTTISSPSADTAINRATGAVASTGGVGFETRVGSIHHIQREGTERMQVRSRASGLAAGVGQADVQQADVQFIAAESLNVFEDRNSIKGGQLLLARRICRMAAPPGCSRTPCGTRRELSFPIRWITC